MKRIALEVLLLATISTVVGLLWNSFSAKGITLGKEIVREKTDVVTGERPIELVAAPDRKHVLNGKDWDADGVTFISLKTAIEYYNDGLAVFVDARKPSEYENGHIPNAISLFADRSDKLIDNVREQLFEGMYKMVYCGGGDCEMSRDLAHDMTALYDIEAGTVYVYAGGFSVWEFNGLPIAKGSERGAKVHIDYPADAKLPPGDGKH